jgi:hypothetical protein
MVKHTSHGYQEAGSSCTAQLKNGEFCNSPSLPDAPFPICSRHAREAFTFGAQLVKNAGKPVPLGRPHNSVLDGMVDFGLRDEAAKPRPSRSAVLYFVYVGGLIKIGATDNVSQRLASYPPNTQILYTHTSPDAWRLESRCHEMFRAYLIGRREWYRDVPEIRHLIAHLEAGGDFDEWDRLRIQPRPRHTHSRS